MLWIAMHRILSIIEENVSQNIDFKRVLSYNYGVFPPQYHGRLGI